MSSKSGKDLADKFLATLPNWTEEQWAEHNRKVQRENERMARAEQQLQRKRRFENLLAGNAPEWIAREVYGPGFQPGHESVRGLHGLSQDAKRVRILSGGTGRGKTWAAVRWLGDQGGSAPFFLRAADFEVAGSYDRQLRTSLAACTALVLDDLGFEHADHRGRFSANLDALVDAHVMSGKRMIITLNLSSEKFNERYSDRMVSRLRQHARWVQLSGPDMRSEGDA